jgi:hypothetical protein
MIPYLAMIGVPGVMALSGARRPAMLLLLIFLFYWLMIGFRFHVGMDYYALENRPAWYRALWRASDALRHAISRLPFVPRKAVTSAIAAAVYYPLARTARGAEQLGLDVRQFPLMIYRRSSFYTMRTDALDRFGTRLEHRFSRGELERMMQRCGLTEIRFRNAMPHWVACGLKA